MKLSIEEALNTGIEAHKAGQFAKADSYYNSILISHPNHPDANHNKGVLVASIGRMEEALPLFKNALEANSCGLPILTFGKTSLKDLIINNKNGFFVDSFDALSNKIL